MMREESSGNVTELDMEVVDAGIDFVLKKLAKGGPKGGGSRGLTEDKVKDLDEDRSVDPPDDGEIILDPTRIIRARNGVGSDVVKKIAVVEFKVKEMTSVVVVAGGEI
jgi:hypothetical protein